MRHSQSVFRLGTNSSEHSLVAPLPAQTVKAVISAPACPRYVVPHSSSIAHSVTVRRREMTTAPPLDGTPSLRSVRDKYLALLLSGSPASPVPAPVSQTPWTPGQHLPRGPTVHWASPVTPAPTENEVRLAEIAAGLVTAGNTERRHTDAIRRLAGQLDRSEKKIRQLQRRERTSSHVHRESGHAQRASYGDAKRNLRFTPRTPKHYIPARRAASEDHRRLSAHPEPDDDIPFRELDELQALRGERTHWVKSKERSQKEAARLSTMLSGIKRNTQRLLEERDSHLKVIASLQDQISEGRRNAIFTRSEVGLPSERVNDIEHVTPPRGYETRSRSPQLQRDAEQRAHSSPARENLQRRMASPLNNNAFQRYPSPHELERAEPGNRPESEDMERQWRGHRPTPNTRRADAFDDVGQGLDSPAIQSTREHELQHELSLVIEENGKLTDRVSNLERECTELVKRVRFDMTPQHYEHGDRPQVAGGSIPPYGNRPPPTTPVREESHGDPLLGAHLPMESERPATNTPMREDPHDTIVQSEKHSSDPKGPSDASASREDDQWPQVNVYLSKLLEEVEVLEGVSQAIQFERTPSEAERLEQTLTDLGESRTYVDTDSKNSPAQNKNAPEATGSTPQVLLDTVKRIGRIRSSLSLKYGKWLEAVAEDASNTCDDTQLSVVGVQEQEVSANADDTTASMNTEVINKLIEN